MFRGELVNPHELRLEKDIEYHEYVGVFLVSCFTWLRNENQTKMLLDIKTFWEISYD